VLNDLAEQVMEAARVGFEAAINKAKTDMTEPTMEELMAAGVAAALMEIPEGFLSHVELAAVILEAHPVGKMLGQTPLSVAAAMEVKHGLGQ
jgi:hypothetical protein